MCLNAQSSFHVFVKDALARNLKRMRCVHGQGVFNFSPLSFNLPNDYTKFVKTYEALRQKVKKK
jgi:tubulin polyglutamylase TTLL2